MYPLLHGIPSWVVGRGVEKFLASSAQNLRNGVKRRVWEEEKVKQKPIVSSVQSGTLAGMNFAVTWNDMRAEAILQKNIKANPAVVFTDLEDGSAVLLDLDSKFYYSLNETGCFMWQVFDGQPSVPVKQLFDKLIGQYEVTEDEARKDIEEFVGNLAKEGLIEVS